MLPFCSRGAAAAVIVFDITSKDSFAKAKSWIKELQRQVSNPLRFMLVASHL